MESVGLEVCLSFSLPFDFLSIREILKKIVLSKKKVALSAFVRPADVIRAGADLARQFHCDSDRITRPAQKRRRPGVARQPGDPIVEWPAQRTPCRPSAGKTGAPKSPQFASLPSVQLKSDQFDLSVKEERFQVAASWHAALAETPPTPLISQMKIEHDYWLVRTQTPSLRNRFRLKLQLYV